MSESSKTDMFEHKAHVMDRQLLHGSLGSSKCVAELEDLKINKDLKISNITSVIA